jgi:hypothetical protein
MSDELFRPTIDPRSAKQMTPPWRVESLAFPAFFGGALAVTVLGLINGRRLGLRRVPLLAIAATGVAAVVARILLTDIIDRTSGTRFLGSLVGIAVWGVIYATQARPYRQFLLLRKDPARLWWPGLAAVLGLGLGEGFAVILLTR